MEREATIEFVKTLLNIILISPVLTKEARSTTAELACTLLAPQTTEEQKKEAAESLITLEELIFSENGNSLIED